MFRPTTKKELRKKIKDIVRGGDIPESWDLSAITDCSGLFSGIEDFSRLEFIQNWDVSNVEIMTAMFEDCSEFNLNLNSWIVSNVENMDYMFENCTIFDQPLDNWDVSRVEYMDFMFKDCINFNQPLNNWNVSRVLDMQSMFRNCKRFNQPLDKWDISSVSDMQSMFRNCKRFNQPLNKWDISNVEYKTDMFLRSGMSPYNMPGMPVDMTQEERAERSNQIAEQMQRAAQLPIDDRKEQPFPECVICGEYLNNIDGPGPSAKCEQDNCDDVVNVCENNHLFHRGCILNSCNAERVDVVSQMGVNQDPHFKTQAITRECPLCKQPLIPNCEGLRNKERVPTEQINKDGLINKGGKRKRKTRGKRKTLGKRKTMKGKKSRKSRKSRKTMKGKKNKGKQGKVKRVEKLKEENNKFIHLLLTKKLG